MDAKDLEQTVHIVQGILARYVGSSVPSPGIVFVRLKSDAAILAQSLGLSLVTGDVPPEERAVIAAGMKAGTVRGVVATDAWSTGIDIPCLRWVAVEPWTKAPIGIQQRIGRGSRLAPGKTSFEVFVLPGRYAEDIEQMLLACGQAAEPCDPPEPGTAEEAADYLLFGKQPHGRRARFERAPVKPSNADVWVIFFLLLVAYLVYWCGNGKLPG